MPKAADRSSASLYRRRLRAVVGLCTWLGAGAVGMSRAHAAPPAAPASSPAAATGEGQQASWAKAYAQGQWSAAIELLETIPEGSRTAWHWLHLARAFERRTQLVEAFAAYERVHDLAAEDGNVDGMREVERQARGESKALATRIPWAEVSLGVTPPLGALVFIDQQWLEPTRLRSPYPVNPGWHTFLIESNGEVLAARRAFFEEGQTRLVPLATLDDTSSAVAGSKPSSSSRPVDRFGIEYDDVSAAVTSGGVASGRTLAGSSAVAGADASSSTSSSVRSSSSAPAYGGSYDRGPAARATAPRSLTFQPLALRSAAERQPDAAHEADRETDPDGAGLLRASYVSLGAGALGTLVGTGFLISALNTRSNISAATANCFSTRCEQNAIADVERTNRTWRARASAATFSYAVGLAGLVTGGVLWVLHRESSSRATTLNIADLSLEVAPRFSPHGATLKGTF